MPPLGVVGLIQTDRPLAVECYNHRVFERFSERAREVVVLAQEEARGLGHNYIGTEHLLLGLLREREGLAARVLERFELGVDEVREQIERIVGRGDEVTTGQIPFTPRAKKVLELSSNEARALGSDWLGTEHILLGVLREGGGVASEILDWFGATDSRVRSALRELGVEPQPAAVRAADLGARRLWLLLAPSLLSAVALGVLLGWLIWG